MAARHRASHYSTHIMPTIHVIGGCRGSLVVMMRGDRTLTGRAARHDIRSPCGARERCVKQCNHEQANACGNRTAPSLTRGVHGHDPIFALRHYSVTRHSLQARQKMAAPVATHFTPDTAIFAVSAPIRPAISQTHSPRVDNWLIPQALALRDKVGSFCRRKKTSERAAAGPPAGKAEGSARRPHRGARRISIVAGIQLESG